ncbi:oligopeptide/dipeptide ABC transporter ATP-binding protein [Pilimelia columellifera]|uniref:Dipeptide ABC transporter ATP-binding protein n=1 Tax=Pilimelia columellifera subsp. columellifera TaxID=706583 RepID=A0ABN3NMM9_9ACTN
MSIDSTTPAPVVSARGLVGHFPVRSRGLTRRVTGVVHAVCGVSFDLYPGQTLALVGESGCGKSTTARLLLNLIRPTAGSVRYGDRELTALSQRQWRPLRRELQLVFQDPYASLDPRMTVEAIIGEPLRLHGRYEPARVRELLDLVGLNPEHANRFPHEFSGGQRQRIGIARALAVDPRVLVLDEPVSALDVSIRAGVLNLLADLQTTLGLSYLFVSHDLSVVRHLADQVAVMYAGQIVDAGRADDLFASPAHPYTAALLSAVPVPDPRRERARSRIVLDGDLPNPVSPPDGCRFRARCPVYAGRLAEAERVACRDFAPTLRAGPGAAQVACHYPQTAPTTV